MKLKFFTSCVLFLTYCGALLAAEPMSADAVKHLLTNNTMYCKNIQKDSEFINYYRDDGTVTKLTSSGEKMQGKWRVSDDGRHCQDWGNVDGECCHPVIDLGNGNYQKTEENAAKSEFTVTEGNPEGL
jgi:hypothetical protein